MWSLVAEDLTHLGGPMGTEYTTTLFTRYFKSVEAAKEEAKKHFAGKGYFADKFKWIEDKGGFRTPDLGWVMYYIKPVVAEDKN